MFTVLHCHTERDVLQLFSCNIILCNFVIFSKRCGNKLSMDLILLRDTVNFAKERSESLTVNFDALKYICCVYETEG